MMTSAPFLVESLGRLKLLHVFGELDMTNYIEFADAMDHAAGDDAEAPLIVGFVECTYVDTSVLTALVNAHRKHARRLHVVVPRDSNVRRIFEATGLHRVLLVHDDFRAAIADASTRR